MKTSVQTDELAVATFSAVQRYRDSIRQIIGSAMKELARVNDKVTGLAAAEALIQAEPENISHAVSLAWSSKEIFDVIRRDELSTIMRGVTFDEHGEMETLKHSADLGYRLALDHWNSTRRQVDE